ncbi:hypothetical protein HYV85_06080 [Candidatus Woesearchaeota archaeon]|nr:hypothetical protein [Candidatus Woesearchaeota archaeon]
MAKNTGVKYLICTGVLLSLVLALYFSIDSAAVAASGCTDTDGGKNIYAKGNVTWAGAVSSKIRTDSCSRLSTNRLLEYYCDGSSLHGTYVYCPSGYKCSDGACVPGGGSNGELGSAGSATGSGYVPCWDSDGGKDVYVTGITKGIYSDAAGGPTGGTTYQGKSYPNGAYGEFQDYCLGLSMYEYSCFGSGRKSYVTQSDVLCQNGCRDGACLKELPPENKCSDSDGGENLYVKGTTSGLTSIGGKDVETDSCSVPGGRLIEYVCNQFNIVLGYSSDCPSGYKCSDGACVSASAPPPVQNVTQSSVCGDGVCNGTETSATCPADCRPADSCTDTDGGNVPSVSGIVFGYLQGASYSYGDICVNASSLMEYFCSGTAPFMQQQACASGCSNGACTASAASAGVCSFAPDGVCPSTCAVGSDADCCTNKGYYVLTYNQSGACVPGCYPTDYTPATKPCSPCTLQYSDSACPNWCSAGSDYDCCKQAGKTPTSSGCV